MNAITIRNLSDEASRALEARAAMNGTSAEVEAEQILNEALAFPALPVREQSGKDLVDALQQLSRKVGGLEDLDLSRDQTPARGVSFE